MEKNIILSSKLIRNEYRTFEPSADDKFIAESLEQICQQTYRIKKGIIKAAMSAKQPVEWLRKYYSAIIEKEISTKQTLLLLEAQLAFVLSMWPADINILMRTAFLGWFGYSLWKCKKNF